jgi:colanic acid biosynthesis glycosyl transferase WcaI
MTRLIILNRYFAPDESATSRMASSLAFALTNRGWKVHVATSRQLYGSPDARLALCQEIRGVVVHRIRTSHFGRRNVLGRVADYLTFYISIFWWLLRSTRPADLLIVATDPPLLSVLASAAASLTGAGRINWLHDLYPEVAAALGISATGPGHRLLQRLRDRSLFGAVMNVAIGERMADYLRLRGVPSDRITVIHNWSDGGSVRPVSSRANPLREQWGLAGKFVVGYSGNLGRGHEFGTILRAAEALCDRPDIHFLFIGAGHYLHWIEQQVQVLGLTNVILKPYQPDSQLSESLSVPDLHLVCLKPSLEGFMVPSKFYGIAAAGRPTVYIGDVAGEIPAILRDADCGNAIPVGDVDALVNCIERLRGSPEQAARWRRNARAVFSQRFDRFLAIDRWCAVLTRVADERTVPTRQVAIVK